MKQTTLSPLNWNSCLSHVLNLNYFRILSFVALICLNIQTCSGHLSSFLILQHLNPLPMFGEIPTLWLLSPTWEAIPHKSWKRQSFSQLPLKQGCGSSRLLNRPQWSLTPGVHTLVNPSLTKQGYHRNDRVWFLRLVVSYLAPALFSALAQDWLWGKPPAVPWAHSSSTMGRSTR